MRHAQFERFEITLSREQAMDCSTPGQDADETVKAVCKEPRVRAMLDKLAPEAIRAELREYGAWDEEELQDEEANRRRIVWIAAGNIREEERA